MRINDREISPSQPPYIVAEISGNHGGKLDTALLLMGAAIGAGADAVKFQAYTPDTITLDCQDNPEFIIKGGPWHGRHLYDLYKATHTPFEWFPTIFKVAKDHGVTVFASVFDASSVDMLERLDCPAYKIASMEIVDIPLIKYVAKTGKPIIISTGMASDNEVRNAVGAVGEAPLALLHCVSGYPTPLEEANLSDFGYLQVDWSIPVGISDHTLGWEVPVVATSMGASIIEKHICLDRRQDIEDQDFSLTAAEFAEMCEKVRVVWKACQPSEVKSEETSRQLRRSLYVVKDIKAGDYFSANTVRSIRPGYGLPPRLLPRVLDCTAACDIKRGTALTMEMVNGLI